MLTQKLHSTQSRKSKNKSVAPSERKAYPQHLLKPTLMHADCLNILIFILPLELDMQCFMRFIALVIFIFSLCISSDHLSNYLKGSYALSLLMWFNIVRYKLSFFTVIMLICYFTFSAMNRNCLDFLLQ